jgi:hypothetical protein
MADSTCGQFSPWKKGMILFDVDEDLMHGVGASRKLLEKRQLATSNLIYI